MIDINYIINSMPQAKKRRQWRNRHYGEQLWQAHHDMRKAEGKR